jgi:hypothetical protein
MFKVYQIRESPHFAGDPTYLMGTYSTKELAEKKLAEMTEMRKEQGKRYPFFILEIEVEEAS